jgi:ABC-type transport system involved in multi-copper enzyme maturation permease subunit
VTTAPVTPPPARPAPLPPGRDGFGQSLRAEWTKVRSVRSLSWTLVGIAVLTALLSMLLAKVAVGTDANSAPQYSDRFSFVHQRLDGDGVVTARVASQQRSHEWAKAGLIVKQSLEAGSPYAAVMVTPNHGVRFESDFDTQAAGTPGAAPRWLRLSRAGPVVTAEESADGATWRRVGSARLGGLPRQVEVGLFVTSPDVVVTEKVAGGSSTGGLPSLGTARFESVALVAVAPQAAPGAWEHASVQNVGPLPGEPGPTPTPGTSDASDRFAGGFSRSEDTFTVTGSGDISGYGIDSFLPPGDDDIVVNSLIGVQLSLLVAVAFGVLVATSEYRTGTVRTTFTATPRRTRVLAAKATVVGGTVLVAGLVGAPLGFLLAQPGLRDSGYAPPAYPEPSLSDGTTLRAVLGTAMFLAVLALFSLAVGIVIRRAARAISFVVALMLVPAIVGDALPSLAVYQWTHRLSPMAGLAIQSTRERWDTPIGPWAGMGVLVAYAAAALGLAYWLLRRRDA